MSNPDYLGQLIEMASAKAGGQAALARQLEVSRGNVTDWKNGNKPCPVADQVLMANIAGLQAEQWVARAVVASHEGTPKGEKLKDALKKLLAATGAAAASSGASAATVLVTGTHSAIDYVQSLLYTMYRKVKFRPPLPA